MSNLKETLSSREKQIATLKGHLEQSKQIIDRQEAQWIAQEEEQQLQQQQSLVVPHDPNEQVLRLESDLLSKCEENQRLRDKIRNEMINKFALPDLMETVLSEKIEEIDNLREDVRKKAIQLKVYTNLELNGDQAEAVKRLTKEQMEQEEKMSARTLSDVGSISDYDVPDIMRRAESRRVETFTVNRPSDGLTLLRSTPGDKRIDSVVECNMITITPEPIPRHIDFSLEDDSKDTKNVGEDLERFRVQLKQKVDENSNLQIELAAKVKLLEIVKAEKMAMQLEVDDAKLKLGQLDEMKSDLDTKETEVMMLKAKINSLEEELSSGNNKIQQLNERIQQKSHEAQENDQTPVLEEEIATLKKLLNKKDEQLTKLEKETLNFAKIERNFEMEVTALRKDLITKSLALEKCKLDLDESINNVLKLHLEMEQIKERLDLNPLTVDEIVGKVEEELNYSAQLDSSILKAIESDDMNSDEERLKSKSMQDLILQTGNLDDELRDLKLSLEREALRNEQLLIQNQELNEHLIEFQQKYEVERNNCIRMQLILDSEKKNSISIQQQDAELLDVMRQRLEEALENESRLQKVIEDERSKVERLANQMNVVQRSKSRDSLLKSPQPLDSPRRKDNESELVMRLESELKLLGSQNDREKERVKDLQQALEREKARTEKEVQDQKEYCEKLTQDLKKAVVEKEALQDNLDTIQEQLSMAKCEIESLEARVSNFEECEARAANRRGRERLESTQNSLEIQDLRLRLQSAEKEREHLQEQVILLRRDIERSAQREAQLTRTLTEERDEEHMATQLAEMKAKMADAMRLLTEERRRYHNYKMELPQMRIGGDLSRDDMLEERANHLFGKYLRVESFRKALVHQKRYLLITLAAYEENEAKAIRAVRAQQPDCGSTRRRRSFRSMVLVVIAIERMKFIVRRWQTGKRVAAKAIFATTNPQILPR